MDNITQDIGLKLKQARKAKELSQIEVAKQAGINANYYARIERGEENPSLEVFKNILKAIGIKSEDILPF